MRYKLIKYLTYMVYIILIPGYYDIINNLCALYHNNPLAETLILLNYFINN
jgi:hypothetical protein